MSQQAEGFNNTNHHHTGGQAGIEPPCKNGTLRLGIFFDGTGNDDTVAEEFSNVKKLFDVYPSADFKKVENSGGTVTFEGKDSAYIRGVGSRSLRDGVSANPTGSHVAADYEADGTLSSAFGNGGLKRINHMIYALQNSMDAFKRELGCYPKTVEFDVFGFSRGAVQARHYVNVLKQGFYKLDGAYDYKPNDFVVASLNIFDSVSSFHAASVITPGTPQDFGWAFHIKAGWVKKAVHLMANDEFRQNFDGQFMYPSNDDYPTDVNMDRLTELLCLGVHSDIGGGYMKVAHGRDNNHLAKIYLNQMYDLASANGVPFETPKPKNDAWVVPDELIDKHDLIQRYYKKYSNSKLIIAHKKLRERLAYLYDAGSNKHPAYDHPSTFIAKVKAHNDKILMLEKEQTPINPSLHGSQQRARAKKYKIIIEQGHIKFFHKLQEAYDELKKAFSGEHVMSKQQSDDYNDFITSWLEFHNTYVHKSHSSAAKIDKKDYDSKGNPIAVERDMAGLQQRVQAYKSQETQLENDLNAFKKGRQKLTSDSRSIRTYKGRRVYVGKVAKIFEVERIKKKELKETRKQLKHYQDALNEPQTFRKRDLAGMNAEVDYKWNLDGHLHRKWYFKKHIDVKVILEDKGLSLSDFYKPLYITFKDESFEWAVPIKL